MKTVLFLRHYRGFTGGHLKLLDYIQHTLASGFAHPRLWLSPASLRNETNIFLDFPELIVSKPCEHDLLFLGGVDWPIAEALGLLRPETPIINLMQMTAHGNARDPFRRWLAHLATRIFGSSEIADAVMATGLVNGPAYTINAGLERPDLSVIEYSARTADVFVSGVKAPELARQAATQLEACRLNVDLLLRHVPRHEFLDRMRRAKVAVLIPLPQEGSYLPAWEAMALDVPVVCTDTPGVHTFCHNAETALLVERSPDALARAANCLLVEDGLRSRLVVGGRRIVSDFSLIREREAFLPVLAHALGAGGPLLEE